MKRYVQETGTVWVRALTASGTPGRGISSIWPGSRMMNCIGGIEQSLPPGVFLLAAGGVDGLFVEVGVHFFSDAAEDAMLPMNSPRWSTRRGANLPHAPGISHGCQRSWFIRVFRSHRSVVRWRQPRSTLLPDGRSQGCHQLADASDETPRCREPRGGSLTIAVSPTGSIPCRENPAWQVTNDKDQASRTKLTLGQ